MNEKQKNALRIRQTDIDGAVNRFGGDINLYEYCLNEFLADNTFEQLNIAIESLSWDEAFTAAHALKGLAGNMGFFPLMHKTGQLVVLIRGGRTKEIPESLNELNSAYRDITDGINQYFIYADEKGDKL